MAVKGKKKRSAKTAGGHTGPANADKLDYSHDANDHYQDAIRAHLDDFAPPAQGSSKQRKQPLSNAPVQKPPADDGIWNTTSSEERERIKDFWLNLGEAERKSLVRVEKEAVLKKMKEQQKHSCSCSVCGRKRTAIEEELEVLYDAYYEELEQYANRQQRFPASEPNALPPPPIRPPLPRGVPGAGGGPPPSRPPPPGRITEILHSDDELDSYDDEDDGEVDDEDDYVSDDAFSDIDGTEDGFYEDDRAPAEFFRFGNSLTVKGGILTVADDLLKNDGKKFIEMMEQLAERRMQREEEAMLEAREFDDEDDEDEYEDDELDSEDYEDEDEEQDALTEEQRMAEGRRMFQIFAARMFEQRVLTAYREKVAQERQAKLLEELEAEDNREREREAKKLKDAAKKKEKKKAQQLKKEEEKARKESELKAEEERKRLEAEQKAEEARKRKEEARLKKENERKAAEAERLKRDEEKKKRLQEEKAKQEAAARERKAKLESVRRETLAKEVAAREAKLKKAESKLASHDAKARTAPAAAPAVPRAVTPAKLAPPGQQAHTGQANAQPAQPAQSAKPPQQPQQPQQSQVQAPPAHSVQQPPPSQLPPPYSQTPQLQHATQPPRNITPVMHGFASQTSQLPSQAPSQMSASVTMPPPPGMAPTPPVTSVDPFAFSAPRFAQPFASVRPAPIGRPSVTAAAGPFDTASGPWAAPSTRSATPGLLNDTGIDDILGSRVLNDDDEIIVPGRTSSSSFSAAPGTSWGGWQRYVPDATECRQICRQAYRALSGGVFSGTDPPFVTFAQMHDRYRELAPQHIVDDQELLTAMSQSSGRGGIFQIKSTLGSYLVRYLEDGPASPDITPWATNGFASAIGLERQQQHQQQSPDAAARGFLAF
ncbi:Stress response protein nst1 [Savitreella phatthalungensis]